VKHDLVLRTFLEDGRLPVCSRFDGKFWEVRVSALSDYFIKQQVKVGFKTPQPSRVFKPIANGPAFRRRMTIGEDSKTCRVMIFPALPAARTRFLTDQRIAAHNWGDTNDDWALD
jgi:hypothetical protein